MRSEGGCGRSGREYGNSLNPECLRGLLMDAGTPYVVPDNRPEFIPPDEGEELAAGDNGLNEGIDSALVRWGHDLADERYYEEAE